MGATGAAAACPTPNNFSAPVLRPPGNVPMAPCANPEPKVPPEAIELNPLEIPPTRPVPKPAIAALFNASPKLSPCIRDPTPEAKAAVPAAPMPNKPGPARPPVKATAATGKIIFAAFLNTFLMPLTNFLRKNSRCPVIGLIEFLSEPTM